jgi:hypothetical protein
MYLDNIIFWVLLPFSSKQDSRIQEFKYLFSNDFINTLSILLLWEVLLLTYKYPDTTDMIFASLTLFLELYPFST